MHALSTAKILDLYRQCTSKLMAEHQTRRLGVYPEPYIVPALQQPHTKTFIILHGRGSNGQLFGDALLQHPIPNHKNLQQAFPHAKFVFPTAAWRRAAAFKRKPITQWFNMWDMLRPGFRDELQIEGLRESCLFLHGLMKQEAAAVGIENVVVGGISQGCATMLIALLLWTGPSPPVVFGMCGRLPYAAKMREAVEAAQDPGDDVFEQGDEISSGSGSPHAIAREWLQQELGIDVPIDPTTENDENRPAIFLGHGPEDEKVPIDMGHKAADFLLSSGFDVVFKEYNGLGHWYSSEMLADIVAFVGDNRQSSRLGLRARA